MGVSVEEIEKAKSNSMNRKQLVRITIWPSSHDAPQDGQGNHPSVSRRNRSAKGKKKKKKLYSDINLLPKEGYTNTGKGKEVALPRQSAVVFFTSTSLSK